jgi:hypothetical protein
MAVSRGLNSGLSGRTRKSAGIGMVESCGSASAASGRGRVKTDALGFALSDDGLPDRGGLMPTPSRRGARDQQLFSFMSG